MIGIDGFVSELADDLLTCYRAAFQLPGFGADAPADVCLINGEDGRTFLSAGMSEDRCCSGFAWVRVAAIAPRSPQPGVPTHGCGVIMWQVELEMGAARCHPVGDVHAGPTCAELEAVALAVQQDAAAMRRALCCFTASLDDGDGPGSRGYSVAPWAPFGPEGGCTGGMMQVAIPIEACECTEEDA